MLLSNLFETPRKTNILIFVICAGLMASAMVLQEIIGLHPCPLCITQRVFLLATGVLALLAIIHNPVALGRRLYAGLGLLAAVGGLGFAARHVWLQLLPEDQVPACGPGLTYMFENFPLTKAFQLLLRGDGNCADIVWTFLGLSIPGWLLVWFSVLGILNIWQSVRRT